MLYIEGENQTSLTSYLCNTEQVLFIYAIFTFSSYHYMHMLSSVASTRNIPVFGYNTTLDLEPSLQVNFSLVLLNGPEINHNLFYFF